MAYRPKYKASDGTLKDLPIDAETVNGKTPLFSTGGVITGGGKVGFLSNGNAHFNNVQLEAAQLAVGSNGVAMGAPGTRDDSAAVFIEGTGENNALIIAMGDDEGVDKIKFRYYNTSGGVAYETIVPASSGTLVTQEYVDSKQLYIHNIAVHGAIGSTTIHFSLTVYSTSNTKVTTTAGLKTLIAPQTENMATGITINGYYGSYITVAINGACNADAPVVAYLASNAASSSTFTTISMASFSGTITDAVDKI